MHTRRLATLLIATLLTAACADDKPPSDPTVADMSATPDATADLPDASPDTPPDAPDAEADAPIDQDMPPAATCVAPAPRLGRGAQAAALAASPARCGMAPYTWLSDERLAINPVPIDGTSTSLRASQLRALLTAGGISLPRDPQYDVRAEVIRYTTQDRGNPIEATAIVAAPLRQTEAPLDILMVLHGTTGFNDSCAPSRGADVRLLAAAIASLGYIVVAPDYIGLHYEEGTSEELHPYLIGEATAIASIDSARAVAKLVADPASPYQSCASSNLLLLGGSQGGHAALWVDRLLPYYGQEFTLLGAVATVPPADLVGQLQRALLDRVPATLNSLVFIATAAPWYGVTDQLHTALIAPFDVDVPDALTRTCTDSSVLPLDRPLDEVFAPALLQAARDGQLDTIQPWGCMAVENSLLTTSITRLNDAPQYAPNYAMLYVLGEDDNLVNTPIERDSFRSLCTQQQMPLNFLECAGASHTRATSWALPEIIDFLDARAAGTPSQAQCTLSAPTRCSATP
jgi:dienelactone hydrolase